MRLDSQENVHKWINKVESIDKFIEDWEKQRKDGKYSYLMKTLLGACLATFIGFIYDNFLKSGEILPAKISFTFLYYTLIYIIAGMIIAGIIWKINEERYKNNIDNQNNTDQSSSNIIIDGKEIENIKL